MKKFFAVKNDQGEWLGLDSDLHLFWTVVPNVWAGREMAKRFAKPRGGRVVELIEAPAKVVVSEKDAEILRGLGKFHFPASEISRQSGTTGQQDRLMRAYVNDWMVEKPKRYLIKVPHTDDSYFYKIDDEICNAGDSYHLEGMTDKKWFTLAEIEHYGLGDCEKVEVEQDGK